MGRMLATKTWTAVGQRGIAPWRLTSHPIVPNNLTTEYRPASSFTADTSSFEAQMERGQYSMVAKTLTLFSFSARLFAGCRSGLTQRHMRAADSK